MCIHRNQIRIKSNAVSLIEERFITLLCNCNCLLIHLSYVLDFFKKIDDKHISYKCIFGYLLFNSTYILIIFISIYAIKKETWSPERYVWWNVWAHIGISLYFYQNRSLDLSEWVANISKNVTIALVFVYYCIKSSKQNNIIFSCNNSWEYLLYIIGAEKVNIMAIEHIKRFR